jgi:hypothetical protein
LDAVEDQVPFLCLGPEVLLRGVDYAESSIKLNEKRHQFFGLSANLKVVSESWLRGGEYSDIFNEKYDFIVCYALIGHLTITERVHLFSRIAKKIKSDHSMFIIYETPNRLSPWDWHSTKIQFPVLVSDDLALLYLQKRLPEIHSWRSKINNFFTPEGWLDWQRQGGGCSYHEFDVTFGLESIEIYLDGYDSPDQFDYQRHQNPNLNFEKALHEVFSKNNPPIPKGFARPSLDLIIKSR